MVAVNVAMPDPIWKVPFDWEARQPWLDLPFPMDEYTGRIARLRAKMAERQLDCLFVYAGLPDLGSVMYLCNFQSRAGHTLLVLPIAADPVLVTTSVLHGEPMHTGIQNTWVRDIVPGLNAYNVREPRNIADMAVDAVRERQIRTERPGLVGHATLPGPIARRLEERLGRAPAAATDLVRDLRKIKGPRELALMRKAGEITDRAIEAGLAAARPGMTESELAAKIAEAAYAGGAERMAVLWVAAGPRSALKNVPPKPIPMQPGDLVNMDVGVVWGGYLTDCHRTLVLGEPTRRQRAMLEACLEASLRTSEVLRPGLPIVEAQLAMRQVAEQAGLLDIYFSEIGFGHGGGLAITEEPSLYWGNPEPFEAGMTFFLEPMFIDHAVGTVCIEDVVAITASGCEFLTNVRRRTW